MGCILTRPDPLTVTDQATMPTYEMMIQERRTQRVYDNRPSPLPVDNSLYIKLQFKPFDYRRSGGRAKLVKATLWDPETLTVYEELRGQKQVQEFAGKIEYLWDVTKNDRRGSFYYKDYLIVCTWTAYFWTRQFRRLTSMYGIFGPGAPYYPLSGATPYYPLVQQARAHQTDRLDGAWANSQLDSTDFVSDEAYEVFYDRYLNPLAEATYQSV